VAGGAGRRLTAGAGPAAEVLLGGWDASARGSHDSGVRDPAAPDALAGVTRLAQLAAHDVLRRALHSAIDGRELPLAEAVAAAQAGEWGTLISCVPGRLAFYYGECGVRRMLLERAPADAA
jgi:hypothetical protein